MDKLRAKIAWLKTCPMWQKAHAAEAALDEALAVIEILNQRLEALERGKHGKN